VNDKEQKVVKGYVTGQAITYFFLSILFMRGTVTASLDNTYFDKPFFFLDRSQIIPIPMINLHINIGYWIMLILAFMCLGLSLFYFMTLFHRKWIIISRDIALYLSIPFSIFVIFNFIPSWATGFTALTSEIKNVVIIGIFAYSGIGIFLLLFVLYILNIIGAVKRAGINQTRHNISKMTKDSLPCL
jgi:hypothetical protein